MFTCRCMTSMLSDPSRFPSAMARLSVAQHENLDVMLVAREHEYSRSFLIALPPCLCEDQALLIHALQ